MPKLLAIIPLWAFIVVEMRATTIVVVRTPVDVSIAAGILGTFLGPEGPENGRSVCKIYQLGDVFLGATGLDNDPATCFSVSQIVSEAIRAKPAFIEKMSAATSALMPKLLSEANTLRQTRPAAFAALGNQPNGGVAIILVGTEDGIPVAVGQRFGVSVDAGGTTRVSPEELQCCPGADCPHGVYTFVLGKREAIDEYHTVRRTIVDSADLARRLVQREVEAHAEGVGGPIDALRITARQQQWIREKPGCPIAQWPPNRTRK